MNKRTAAVAGAALAATIAASGAARADGDQIQDHSQAFALHAQTTFVAQADNDFASPYVGANSLKPNQGRETWDVTLYAGLRLWRGAELWVDPEVDQGFGLSGTLGVAGFPSGEAYKVGAADPYFRLQRLFLRQTIGLGGKSSSIDADLNQLAGPQTADRIVVTVGKFGVTDVFDANDYAHDPRHDFLNWALIDTGTFDYAADAWGYTVGAAVEDYVGDWTVRAGLFDLSDVPNSTRLDPDFHQYQAEGELERRYRLAGRDGSIKLTGFLSRARMGAYADALESAAISGAPPSTADVRHYRSRAGLSLDLQQTISSSLGGFVRAGFADGAVEPYEFADIDRTFAAGLSLKGKRWDRADDTVGLAGVLNGITQSHQHYLADGGLGILVGDGRLPHGADEAILEAYYDVAAVRLLHITLDYQYAAHPAYNPDRGPVAIFGLRLHAQI